MNREELLSGSSLSFSNEIFRNQAGFQQLDALNNSGLLPGVKYTDMCAVEQVRD